MFSWAHLGLVVLGGALGTAVRAGLTLLVGPDPVLVPVINITGAFLLGLLVGGLSRRRPSPRSRALQHLLGTGALGGFTTYSALAVESADLPLLWLGIASAAIGTFAAWGGLLLGRGGRRR